MYIQQFDKFLYIFLILFSIFFIFQNDLYKEQVEIDSRVHSRLIGARGRNIRKLMDDFKVDIKFPRSEDANCNLVTIIGPEDNVLEAKDHLLNLEEEYVS